MAAGGGGELRLAAIDACFRRQSVDAIGSPGVVPRLDRLLAEMAATGAGYSVFAAGQFPDDLLQLAPRQPFAADQRAEDRQAKQGLRVNLVHEDSS